MQCYSLVEVEEAHVGRVRVTTEVWVRVREEEGGLASSAQHYRGDGPTLSLGPFEYEQRIESSVQWWPRRCGQGYNLVEFGFEPEQG